MITTVGRRCGLYTVTAAAVYVYISNPTTTLVSRSYLIPLLDLSSLPLRTISPFLHSILPYIPPTRNGIHRFC
jgi:hypothetical protein